MKSGHWNRRLRIFAAVLFDAHVDGVDYVLPQCEGKVFLVSRAPDRSRQNNMFSDLVFWLGSLF